MKTKYLVNLFIFLISSIFAYGQGDDPCSAVLLTVGPSCNNVSGNNTGSTNSAIPDAVCDGVNSNGDVWYSAIIGSNGTLIIKTVPGSLTDMGMAIYTGTTCGTLVFNSCVAGGSPGFPSMPYKSLSGMTPGSEIWIRLWDVNNDETGTFSICAYVNCSASVTITGSATGCTANPVQLCTGGVFSSYSWSTGASSSCINVNSTATYTVTVTDADGCTATDSHSFTANTSPTVTITGPAFGCTADNPQLCVPAGFTTYNWSNGGSSTCIAPSSSNNYSVTVTAANGCTASSTKAITIFTSPSVSVTGPPSKCSNGPEQLCVPNTFSIYSWSNGGVANCITPTSSGTYSVSVTDANGCTATASQSITVHTSPSIAVTGPASACAETNPQLCVPGGYSSYSWSNGGTTNCINPVTSGNYTATVTDAFGCTGSNSHNISVLASPTVSISGPASACDGDTIQLCATAGMTNYAWSNGGTSNCITPVSSGTYTVIVTNANGCTSSTNSTFTLNDLPASTITGPSSTCNGAQAQLCAPAGNSSYLWSNNNTNSCINTAISGNYSVIVTGTNGCTSSSSFQLTVFPPFAMTISGPTTACRSANPQLCATTGNYTYQWSNGATTACINPTVSGVYTVVATNQNGCTRSASKGLTVYASLNASIQGPTSACTGAVVPLCGPDGSSSYVWSTGQTTKCINVNGNGVYTITISDVHGCTASASQTVTFSSSFAIDITGPVSGCTGNVAELCVPSGYTNYTWNTGATTECINVTNPGSYSVTVHDPVGCVANDSFSVAFNSPPNVSIVGSSIICKNTLSNWCATGGYPTYLWSNGGTGHCINVNTQGNYSVTVTDNNGCTSSVSAPLVVVNISPVILESNGLLICDTFNTAYTYEWLINGLPTGCTDDTCSPGFSGIYTVIVTDTVSGCTENDTYNYINISVGELEYDFGFSLYPNPFHSNEFKIEFNYSSPEKIYVEIYNVVGSLMHKEELMVSSDNFSQTISLPEASRGIYYVCVRSKERVLVKKIVRG